METKVLSKAEQANQQLLEKVNSNLVKILNAIKGNDNIKIKNKFDFNSNENDMSGLDKVKYIFGGISSLGRGIKESVKSTFSTKPETSSVISSAEALEARDSIKEPKQVELDQLKIAEENNDTQKEILKELKKLNEISEEKPSSSGVGLPDVKLGLGNKGVGGKTPGGFGRAAGAGSKFGMGAAGGVAAGAAAVGLLGGLTYLGFQKESQIAETKDEAVVKKAELDEKLQSSAATIEEAAGSGLSKEDAIFAKKGRFSFFKPKTTETKVGEDDLSFLDKPKASSSPIAEVSSTATPPTQPPATKVGGAIAATSASATGGNNRAAQAEASPLGALQFLKSLGILPKGDSYELMPDFTPISKEEVAKKVSAAGKNPDKVLQLASEMGKPSGETIDVSSGNLNQITDGAIGGQGSTEPAASVTPKETVTGNTGYKSLAERRAAREAAGTPGPIKKDPETEKMEGRIRQYLRGEDVTLTPAEEQHMKKMESKINARADTYNADVTKAELATSQETRVSAKMEQGTSTDVSRTSSENQAIRDEMNTTKGTTTPIVSNNVTNTSTNNYIPIKSDPRPNNRGSALDNYVGRVSTY